MDFHDGTPIKDATIFVKSMNRYTVSDEDGRFKIDDVCDGPLILVVSHVGCETRTVTYNVNNDVFETIYLEHHIEELEEVSLEASGTKKETLTAQETIIDRAVLTRYSSMSFGDAIKEVQGVYSINTGNTIVKPMINGMHSSRLLILNNNVRLQDQEWGIEHAPNIDINSADKISVIKGAGTLAYGGDAIGGVLLVKPSRVVAVDTLYGKTIVSGQSNGWGMSVNSALNKSYKSGWYAHVQGSVKQNGDFSAPDYNLSNTGLKSKGLTLRGGKKSFESGFELFYSFYDNEIGILRASHIGNIDDLVNAINNQQPLVINDFSYDIEAPKQDVTHNLFKGSYFKRFRNFGKVNLQYDYQHNRRFEFDVRVGSDRDKAAVDLKLQTHTISGDVSIDSKNNTVLNFGFLGRYQNNFANPDTGVRRLIPDYDKYDLGVYFTSEWTLTERLFVDAGLRYDFNRIDADKFYQISRWEERGYDVDFPGFEVETFGNQLLTNPFFDYNNLSASAGIKYDITDRGYISGQYALSSRPPNPSELFSDGLHHSAARIELGDLRLGREISNRFAGSYYYTSDRLSIVAESFVNSIRDFIYLEPSGVEQTIRGAFPVWEYRKTKATFAGLDLGVNYEFNDRIELVNKSSYIFAEDNTNDRPIIDIPGLSINTELIYRNDKWFNFVGSLESEAVFEQNRFPDNNFEAFLPSANETVLVDISTPPPGYHLLHFYSQMTFDLSEQTNMNISFSINNILNTKYRAYLNRLRYFSDDIGRNFMLQIQLNY